MRKGQLSVPFSATDLTATQNNIMVSAGGSKRHNLEELFENQNNGVLGAAQPLADLILELSSGHYVQSVSGTIFCGWKSVPWMITKIHVYTETESSAQRYTVDLVRQAGADDTKPIHKPDVSCSEVFVVQLGWNFSGKGRRSEARNDQKFLNFFSEAASAVLKQRVRRA